MNSVLKIAIATIFMISFGVAAKNSMQGETLCRPSEEVYFSCETGQKIISLCAIGNVSPDRGTVQYRFGTPENTELIYPPLGGAPAGKFSISDIFGGNLNFTNIKFRSGDYDYVIYDGNNSGIYVLRAGKTVVNLRCKSETVQGLNSRAFRGIETVPPDPDIDD
ncbi:hypothetical protein [Cupriavidus campinensis]